MAAQASRKIGWRAYASAMALRPAKIAAERGHPALLVAAQDGGAPVPGLERLADRLRRHLGGIQAVLDALAGERVDVAGGVAHDEEVVRVAPPHAAQAKGRRAHRGQPRAGPQRRRHVGVAADDVLVARPEIGEPRSGPPGMT